MKLNDRILQHVVDRHLVPAWKTAQETLELRAGDVHKEMRLLNRMPAVCSVLGSNRFKTLTRVYLLDRQGPQNGANAIFKYRLR
jgi:hypothetical protein